MLLWVWWNEKLRPSGLSLGWSLPLLLVICGWRFVVGDVLTVVSLPFQESPTQSTRPPLITPPAPQSHRASIHPLFTSQDLPTKTNHEYHRQG